MLRFCEIVAYSLTRFGKRGCFSKVSLSICINESVYQAQVFKQLGLKNYY